MAELWPPLVAATLAALLAVRLLPHRRLRPSLAVGASLAELTSRALLSVALALALLVAVPKTSAFAALAQWSEHNAIPFPTDIDLSGDPFAHATALAPLGLVVLSLSVFCLGSVRATHKLRAVLRNRSLGPGPSGSTVIAERGIALAVAGLRKPEVVVSTAALTTLDEQELQAALAHERGHVVRFHRPLCVAGAALRSLGCLLPGARRAERRLAEAIERDADQFAVQQTGDALALASAICKAAGSAGMAGAQATALSGGSTTVRLQALVEPEPDAPRLQQLARVVVLALAATTLTLAALALNALAQEVAASGPLGLVLSCAT